MDCYDLYAKGKRYLSRPSIAQAMFEEAYQFPQTRYKSLLQLISLDLKNGNLKHARQLINEHMNEYGEAFRFNVIRSHLEHEEYNFNTERSIIYNNLSEQNYESSILNLADIELSLGNYTEAFEHFYEMLSYDKYKVEALFGMTTTKILEGDFDTAQNILTIIDYKNFINLSNKDQSTYRDLRTFLKFFRGKLKLKNITNVEKKYKYYRLFDEDNQSLYKHLEKHKNSRYDHNDGCFFFDLDLVSLVDEVEYLLIGARPIHYLGTDKYRINMGRAIGKLGEQKMYGLCVVTVINTKKIITMYPIILSRNFDTEGYGKILLPNN